MTFSNLVRFAALSLALVAQSAFAGGGSSGSKGGGAKGCLVEKITLAVESSKAAEAPGALTIGDVQYIATVCGASPNVAACLVEENANGNPVTEEILVFCENAYGESSEATAGESLSESI